MMPVIVQTDRIQLTKRILIRIFSFMSNTHAEVRTFVLEHPGLVYFPLSDSAGLPTSLIRFRHFFVGDLVSLDVKYIRKFLFDM